MTHAVVVNGAAGRMGRLVATSLREAGLDVAGCDAATSGPIALADGPLEVVADLASGVAPGGVIVDFSHPSATAALVGAVEKKAARLVVGTTGQGEEEAGALRAAAETVPVVLARNFSLGLNRLLEVLPRLHVLLTDGFDVECLEAHHRGKRDAPSGTAEAMLEAFLGKGKATRVHGRHGREARRQPGEIGVHSLRLGQLAGEHALLFASDHELVEIRHRALDRAAFVTGVLPALHFVQRAAPGLYTMQDVIRDAATAGD